jgi:threonine/homoserine/homoserine lactone efflux protein
MEDPALFALAVLTLLITPGPTNTLLATAGAAAGFRRSAHLLLGELAGYNVSIYLLGNLFDAETSGSKVRVVLSLVAGAYLIFTAIRFWRTRLELQRATVSLRQVLVTTLLNPKALVFAFLIVPMHTPNTWLYLATFSAIVVVVGSIWIAFGTLAGRVAGSRYLTVVPKAASVVLIIFAATLIGTALAR